MKIFSQTPVRIGLIGGGTDVNPFAADFGGKVFSLAINLYHQVSLKPIKEEKIYIEALGKTIEKDLKKDLIYGKEKDFDLVYAIINYFKPLIKSGFKLKVEFQGESLGGLGSSGSAGVAMIAVFSHWLKRGLSRMEMAYLAWRMETQELKWSGGKQDQLAAAFGGINLLTFGAKESIGVIPLFFPKDLIKRIRKWMILFYIGGKRHSGKLQKNLSAGMKEEEKIEALKGLKRGVNKMIKAWKKEDFNLIGEILDEAWDFKKRSNPKIANSRVNDLYELAKKNGSRGGENNGGW